ncbi:hypothetical protein [Methanobrevibacter sp.]|uniref:hypothetical protein n=1 Tax=Methanobrevibacter sp. TaxID=66852 RepID=UPI0026E073D7|nr:hypothetical protein [Methanobrevibacter sp.]MDO5824357.1 hypothetical protein [Methanobrevibacter sp.]
MKLCFYPNDLKIAPKKSPRFTIHKECIMTFISLFSVLGTYCHQQSYPILIISPTDNSLNLPILRHIQKIFSHHP